MLLYGDRVDSWTPFYQQGHNAVLSVHRHTYLGSFPQLWALGRALA